MSETSESTPLTQQEPSGVDPERRRRSLIVLAAVAVSVIKAGLTSRRRTELIAAITGLARQLSIDLGAPPESPTHRGR